MLSSDLRFNLRTNLKKSSLKKKLFKTCTKSSLFRACKVWKKVALFSKACEIKYRACVHRLLSIYDTLVTFSHTCNFCMHFFNRLVVFSYTLYRYQKGGVFVIHVRKSGHSTNSVKSTHSRWAGAANFTTFIEWPLLRPLLYHKILFCFILF